MQKPYGLIADLHLHAWSKFSNVNDFGENSRLRMLLDEITKVSEAVDAYGGDTIVIAGDLFHVRGTVKPSVLNPTIDLFKQLTKAGMKFIILAGNHDLEGKDASRLGSAIQSLEMDGITIVNDDCTGFIEPMLMVMPWHDDINKLKDVLSGLAIGLRSTREETDLIIHAPIDGVLHGLSGGLDPKFLADLGFKRVFAGHYHNYKAFPGAVYSIGALAHHTWSDINSKAGHLIVHHHGVNRFDTSLPKFIDVGDVTDEFELDMVVSGNYVRFRTESASGPEIEQIRKGLFEKGAKGVEIIAVPKAVEERTGAISASVAAGASIERSVSDFIASKSYARPAEVEREALKLLSEVTE